MHVVERLQSLQWRKGLFLYDQLTPCLVRDVREEGGDHALALGLGTAVQTSWAAQCKQLSIFSNYLLFRITNLWHISQHPTIFSEAAALISFFAAPV